MLNGRQITLTSAFYHRSSQAWCLKDEPKHVAELQFPDKLPGELYNADVQCKWQFGHSARLCMFDFSRVGHIKL